MELQAEDRPRTVADRGDGAGIGSGQGNEVAVDRWHLVAVAHPHDGLFRHPGEQRVGLLDPALGAAKLTAAGWLDRAAERLAGQLHAVADAEDGDAKIKEGRVAVRSAGFVDAGRTAGEDETTGTQFSDACGRQVMAHQLAENILLADAPSDELGVLRAEVEDQDAFTFGQWRHLGSLLP